MDILIYILEAEEHTLIQLQPSDLSATLSYEVRQGSSLKLDLGAITSVDSALLWNQEALITSSEIDISQDDHILIGPLSEITFEAVGRLLIKDGPNWADIESRISLN